MFDPVDPHQSLPKLERGILEYWKLEDIFKRSVKGNEQRPNEQRETFTFYDGPPFATGLPHYGHLLAGTIKDVIPRYQTMRGKRVERRWGWDCHGLPVENEIEAEHKFKGKRDIEERVGVKGFNELCRGIVQRHTSEWRTVVERTGRWVDMDFDYRTMDPEYMESVWWAFKTLWKKGLIYEGHKSMHVCPRCATPLSNFEVTLGYKEVVDETVTAKFRLVEEARGTKEAREAEEYLLAWTTTPWTLPGNLFLAVHPAMDYVKLKTKEGETVVFGKEVFERSKSQHAGQTVLETLKGKNLLGYRYAPLFPYFTKQYQDKAYRVVDGTSFVSAEEGTGIVHIAPGFGEDDYRVGEREEVEVLMHVTPEGAFVDAVKDFAGLPVKPADDPSATDRKVIAWLKKHGKLFATQPHKHSYPHCWRCESPLLNYTCTAWFVAVEKIKKDLLKANAKTRWVPDSIRTGRFSEWLENARDWCISRQRFWGTPLPIWRCERVRYLLPERPGGCSAQKVPDPNLLPERPGGCSAQKVPDPLIVIGSRDELMSKCPERFTKVTIARHAESEGNVRLIYQGKEPGTDLTENGVKQAEALAERIRSCQLSAGSCQLTAIYCSPLARAQQTAEIINEIIKCGVVTDKRLRELDFGPYEGQHVDLDSAKLREQREDKILHRKVESIYHFEGMETWESVEKRLRSFLDEVLPKHRGGHIMVITHADPCMNFEHIFTELDKYKVSHRPHPKLAEPRTYYFDHETGKQMDLHRETVDTIEWGSGSGSAYKRIPEVLDCWFESGSMPYAQAHFPFEMGSGTFCRNGPEGAQHKRYLTPTFCRNGPEGAQHKRYLTPTFCRNGQEGAQHKRYLTPTFCRNGQEGAQHKRYLTPTFCRNGQEGAQHKRYLTPSGFPADFIAEGLDQTRGWFYTLMVLSVALFKEPPFRNCVVNGIVLAEDGKKMSKRLKNYPEPTEVVEKHGADAMRLALMSSPAVRAEELRFSERLVEEQLRGVLMPLWNAYCFFVTYANAASWQPPFETPSACHAEEPRACRGASRSIPEARWAPQGDTGKKNPLDRWILAQTQNLVNKMTEELEAYDLSAACAHLRDSIDGLTNWYIRRSRRRFAGKTSKEDQLQALETLYSVLMTISKLLAPFCPFITDAMYLNLVNIPHDSIHLQKWPEPRKLTKKEFEEIERTELLRSIVALGMRVRSDAKIKVRQPLPKASIALPTPSKASLTKVDLNAIEEELNVKEVELVTDPSALAETVVEVNPRALGPRLGDKVQKIIKEAKAGKFTENDDGTVRILDEVLSSEEASISYKEKEGQHVASERGIVIAIDTRLDESLVREGQVRDLIRAIQQMRKDAGLTVAETATIQIDGAEHLMKEYGEMILEETRSQLGKGKKALARIEVELRDTYVAVSLLPTKRGEQ
jgi:isoleucyl-tRNA synthetase